MIRFVTSRINGDMNRKVRILSVLREIAPSGVFPLIVDSVVLSSYEALLPPDSAVEPDAFVWLDDYLGFEMQKAGGCVPVGMEEVAGTTYYSRKGDGSSLLFDEHGDEIGSLTRSGKESGWEISFHNEPNQKQLYDSYGRFRGFQKIDIDGGSSTVLYGSGGDPRLRFSASHSDSVLVFDSDAASVREDSFQALQTQWLVSNIVGSGPDCSVLVTDIPEVFRALQEISELEACRIILVARDEGDFSSIAQAIEPAEHIKLEGAYVVNDSGEILLASKDTVLVSGEQDLIPLVSNVPLLENDRNTTRGNHLSRGPIQIVVLSGSSVQSSAVMGLIRAFKIVSVRFHSDLVLRLPADFLCDTFVAKLLSALELEDQISAYDDSDEVLHEGDIALVMSDRQSAFERLSLCWSRGILPVIYCGNLSKVQQHDLHDYLVLCEASDSSSFAHGLHEALLNQADFGEAICRLQARYSKKAWQRRWQTLLI